MLGLDVGCICLVGMLVSYAFRLDRFRVMGVVMGIGKLW